MPSQGDVRTDDIKNCPDEGRPVNATRTFMSFIYADRIQKRPRRGMNVHPALDRSRDSAPTDRWAL